MGCPTMWLGVCAESEKDPLVLEPAASVKVSVGMDPALVSVVKLFTWTKILIQLVVPGICTPN